MKIKDLNKKYKKKIRLDEIVTINCDDGECYLKSSSGVSGIEINFEGQAKITPQLPEGWILQGNNNKLIIFSLQNKTIENQMLFIYEGFMKITSVIACNNKSERYNETFNKSQLSWGSSNWEMNIENDTWNNFKDKRKKGSVKTTSYNLPDYGLPKLDKTKIKTKRRTSTSSYTTGGGSSGGSGGY